MTALTVQGVRKAFGSLVAVDDVSFEVQKGSCFGLLGPNGAGKTTTISMIVGVLSPDGGKVALNGQAVDTATKSRIGYVPQELALYEELSANDNLHIFGSLYGLAGGQLAERMGQALQIVNLADRAKDRVNKYSGGMKRRLNIALALMHDPELIVLDEPTVGVDPQSRNAIFDTLKMLQASGKTLIYTTHYMEEVEKLCDTIAVMDHGKLIAIGSLRDLQAKGTTANVLVFDVPSLPDAMLASVSSLPGVATAEYAEGRLTVGVTDIGRGLASVSRLLGEGNVGVVGVESSKPSLESLFLELTGRSLRD